MSRHRNFHNMDYDDERDDDDYDEDYYGRSVDDERSMSPSQSQFVYQRQRLTSSNNYTAPAAAKLFDFIPDVNLENDVVIEDDTMFAMEGVDPASVSNRVSFGYPPGLEPVVPVQPVPTTTKPPLPKPAGFSITRLPDTESPRPSASTANDEESKPLPAAVSHLKAGSTPKRSDSKSPSRGSNSKTIETPKGLSATSSTHRLSQLAAISSAPCTPRRDRRKDVTSKELINLVVVGHVDAGKSTLMGHVLYKLGCVDQRTIHKYQRESALSGKSSFAFAWVLDETEEERARGVTMDIARTQFETDNRRIVLLDAPGHKDFIPNMITGASQADAALLVVNSTTGEFETGFEKGGQTREHAMLLRSLGVSQLIVAINKLDTVDWSRDRYFDVEAQMRVFLERNAGFTNIRFVPVSGLSGDNLVERVPPEHPLSQWYDGECLAELIDTLKSPKRASDGPLRAVINDIFKATNNQLSLTAKIESGELDTGDKVFIMPNADAAVVKAATNDDGGSSDCVMAGDQVLLTLNGVFEPDTIQPGHVITRAGKDALMPGRRFTAKIVVFDIAIPIMKGTKAELFCHSLCEPVTFKKLVSEINKSNGKVLKDRPRCLARNQSGIVVLETDKDIAVEAYTVCKALGRITIRANGQTIAAGIIEGRAD